MFESATGQSETARYECRCGGTMTFREREFDHLRWLSSKFGYRNPAHAIADIRDCCEYPEYLEVTAP